MEDRRCKLGLRGRLELVELIESGQTFRAAAAALNVSPATAHRWWRRWQAAEQGDRVSLACLRTRPPRPRSCPWALGAEAEQAILAARQKTNWGPMRLTFLTGRHRSTIWKVLHRHGCSSRPRSAPRQTTRRYEWAEAGALLHIDAFRLPKFDAPGHWATGDRSKAHRSRDVGTTVVIGVVDDHTRLAYCELHSAENAINASRTLRRAAQWFAEQGCGPVEAVMSDNAKCYATSREFRHTLTELGVRQILIPPYTPRWNGKIERFWGTADREWARSRSWPTATARWHPSSASTTAGAHTQPPAATHRSAAFTKTAGRTASRGTRRTGTDACPPGP